MYLGREDGSSAGDFFVDPRPPIPRSTKGCDNPPGRSSFTARSDGRPESIWHYVDDLPTTNSLLGPRPCGENRKRTACQEICC